MCCNGINVLLLCGVRTTWFTQLAQLQTLPPPFSFPFVQIKASPLAPKLYNSLLLFFYFIKYAKSTIPQAYAHCIAVGTHRGNNNNVINRTRPSTSHYFQNLTFRFHLLACPSSSGMTPTLPLAASQSSS
jgi:hypothetical protein